jgi:Family of unknown function (DUF5302)
MTDKPNKPTSTDDDLHKKFREALERKRRSPHETPESEPGHREGTGPADADVPRKEFRRKTG